MVVIGLASVVLLWGSGARAGEEDEQVIVETVEAYDELFARIENPDRGGGSGGGRTPTQPQLWDGLTGVTAPHARGEIGGQTAVGQVLTEHPFATGPYTETWVVRDPEAVLRGDVDLDFLGRGPSRTSFLWSYQALPDARDYSWLQFTFTYQPPPTAASLVVLPTSVPWFVTDVLQFSVTTDVGGVVAESGALYRERTEINGVVEWRDLWVLWTNYQFPNAGNGAITRLDLQSTDPTVTARAFLQNQASFHQLWYVRTKSPVTPVL